MERLILVGVECLLPLKSRRKLKALETLFLSFRLSSVPVLSFLIIFTLKLGLLLAKLPVLHERPHGSNNAGSMGVRECAGGNPPHLGRHLRVKGGLKCA